LLDGLARLDPIDRAVLVLRYWEDLDVKTTADLLGLSPANVRTRCVRALDRLRAVLGADLLDLPGR
jgi:RNA polymerase sigma factor (sigma-70 family)